VTLLEVGSPGTLTPEELEHLLARSPAGLALETIVPGLVDERPRKALLDAERRVVVRRGGVAVAAAALSPNAWDSRQAGAAVGQVDALAAVDDEARGKLLASCGDFSRRHGWDHLYARALISTGRELGVAERLGFVAVDALLTFGRAVPESPAGTGPGTLRLADAADVAALCEIARECFRVSRFHSDPLFSARAAELHAEWTWNSFHGGLADDVLVHEEDGRPAAFATLKRWSSAGHALATIVLLGVGAPWRGRGAGRRLLAGVLRWLAKGECGACVVGTQAYNLPAIGLYAGAGFRAISYARTMKWSGSRG
jgi:RimJ/RimL family protein N-acetyltransferase